MAKQVNIDTPLYSFISRFYKKVKDNSYGDKDDFSFINMADILWELEDENLQNDKNMKGNAAALVNEADILFGDYRAYVEESMPEGMMPFISELRIKTETSVKNFRAQWVVGWIKHRKNFDAAYTFASILTMLRFSPEFVDMMEENGFRVVRLHNAQDVISYTLDLLYSMLPANTISDSFKNTVYTDEPSFFRVLFYGLLYLISISDTDNNLYNNNDKYHFTDVFHHILRKTETEFGSRFSTSFTGYYTTLFNHTKVLRSGKHDRASEKKTEKTFVTPALEDDYGKASIRKGKINVLMGMTGQGKSSLLYAFSASAVYDKTDNGVSEPALYEKLRNELQRLTDMPLEKTMPVYFYATDYRKQNGIVYPSVNQFAYGVQGLTDDGSDLERLLHLHSGHIMFLVDAIDEMSPELRKDFMMYLREIKNKYPTATFVITTRNIRQQIFDDLTTEVYLLKIVHSDENIRKMISNYINLFGKNGYSAEEFYNRLKSNSYLKNILRNPYQIQKTIATSDHLKAIHPVYVYDSLISSIVEDKWGGLFDGLSPSAVIDVLRVLACYMNGKNSKKTIPAAKLAGVLKTCASEAGIHGGIVWEDFSDSIAIRSGLLLYDDISNGFEFMSDEFMNYLTAQWIYRQYSNKWRSLEKVQFQTGVTLNKYIYKGILADCLKKYKPSKEGLIMLFYYANYKEDGGLSGDTDTVQLLMEMMLEDALMYGDDAKNRQLAQLLKEDIPQSDMGIIYLETKEGYNATGKL